MDIKDYFGFSKKFEIRTFSDKTLEYWFTDDKTASVITDKFNGRKLEPDKTIDTRLTIILNNGMILHRFFQDKMWHLFKTENDYSDFFDKIFCQGIAVWYENETVIYYYSLKDEVVRQLHQQKDNLQLLKTFNDGYFSLYKLINRAGVILVEDSKIWDQVDWFPSLEVFETEADKSEAFY